MGPYNSITESKLPPKTGFVKGEGRGVKKKKVVRKGREREGCMGRVKTG